MITMLSLHYPFFTFLEKTDGLGKICAKLIFLNISKAYPIFLKFSAYFMHTKKLHAYSMFSKTVQIRLHKKAYSIVAKILYFLRTKKCV